MALTFILMSLCVETAFGTLQDVAMCAFADSFNSVGQLPSWNCSNVSNCCYWAGVQCDATGAVVVLSAISIAIANTVPTEIGYLTLLQEIQFLYLGLVGTLPTQIGALSFLRMLDISSNSNFGPSLPVQLSKLSFLVFLQLRYNGFAATIPSEYGSLTSLTRFELTGNPLIGSIPPELSNLTRLQYVGVGESRLTGTLPSSFSSWSNLDAIYISGTSISGTIPSSYAAWTLLTSFAAFSTRLSGVLPPELSAWSQLVELSLTTSNLQGISSYCWPFASSLDTCVSGGVTVYNCSFCTNPVPNCSLTIDPSCPPTAAPTLSPTVSPTSAAPSMFFDFLFPFLFFFSFTVVTLFYLQTLLLVNLLGSAPLGVGLCGDGQLNPGEECDDGNTATGDGCDSNCFIEQGWVCLTTIAPSNCSYCFGEWIPLQLPGSVSPFCSSCDNGSVIIGRYVSSIPLCARFPNAYSSNCSFPCELSQLHSLQDIANILTNTSYMTEVMNLLGVKNNFSFYQINSKLMAISFFPCNATFNTTYIQSIISLMLSSGEIVSRDQANCTIYLALPSSTPMSWYYYLALLPLVLLLLLVFIAFAYYYTSPVHDLPKEISWSFVNRLKQPWRWTKEKSYYIKGILWLSKFQFHYFSPSDLFCF
jgi:cysteine-rich repeat protein